MQDEDGAWSIFGNNYRGDVERVQRGSYSNGWYNNRYAYDAFGNYSEETDSPKKNPFRYSGEYTDDETGFIYLRNRYYDPAIGRFITEDPAKDGLNWYAYCGNNPIHYVDPWGLEYLVVSGSENNTIFDRRYKYNFIEPAIKKLKELKGLNDGEQITWLISSTGYSKTDIKNFKNTAESIGVNIEFFSNKDEFIGYINSKGVGGSNKARDEDKIRKIAVFSHGLVGSIEFGYHQSNQKSLSLTSTDILRLRKGAFDNPNSCFYSCNTATTDPAGTSFAQQWVNVTGGKTWAIYEKSDYGHINNWDNWRNVIKPERKETGYRPNGSDFYPIPSSVRNAYWQTFTGNTTFRGVK